VQDMVEVKPDNLCQLLHHYFVMRVHLPFTMRQNGSNDHVYSRLTCIEACEAVAQRYQALRHLLPSGIFLSPMMDLQALTATVTLLLTTHSGAVGDRLEFQANKARVQEIAAQVLKVMEEKSGDTAGANFARQGALTIRSLSALLQQNQSATGSRQLNLKVPLLGNINIRRNLDLPQAPATSTQQPMQMLPRTGPWDSTPQSVTQPFGDSTLSQGQLPPQAMQESSDWQWNPLSWSIEATHDNAFQDVFMADNMDQFGTWQGEHNNFQI